MTDLTQLPPFVRPKLLRAALKPTGHIVSSEVSDRTLPEMLALVREHGLEDVVAKRIDNIHQPVWLLAGLWTKRRINLGEEFVVGGYTRARPAPDALAVGFYRVQDLAMPLWRIKVLYPRVAGKRSPRSKPSKQRSPLLLISRS